MYAPLTIILIMISMVLILFYILFKNIQYNYNAKKYENKLLNARFVIANKDHCSKIAIQRAQQFIDMHNTKKV